MQDKVLFSAAHLQITLHRLAHELVEHYGSFEGCAIIGLQPRGVALAMRIHKLVMEITQNPKIEFGTLDITFYRDDYSDREQIHLPAATDLPFSLSNKRVLLIDDVLYTGRTIRAGLEALVDHGRPASVELLVLIDRRLSREQPIQADYVGMQVDSIASQRVKVRWKEEDGADEVIMIQN